MPQALEREHTYELPFPYGEDYIFMMLKDPKSIFAYWEISDARINDFQRVFGADAISCSSPMLKIVNLQNNNENFIRVNDFSKDWYINISDPGGDYYAEIGRQFKDGFYVCFSRSNRIKVPDGKPSAYRMPVFANYKDIRSGRASHVEDSVFEGCMPYESYAAGSEMMFDKKDNLRG